MPRLRMRILVAVALCASLLATAVRASQPADAMPAGFADQAVFGGLVQPTRVAFAPDGSVYVAEKAGKILRFASLQATTPTVAIDLRPQVYSGWDRGIVGLALDPKFTSGRPYLYALYTLDALPGGAVPTSKPGAPRTSAATTPPSPGQAPASPHPPPSHSPH